MSVITVWGSPSAGKTLASVKLALEAAAMGKNVLLLCCDAVCPVIQTLLPHADTAGKSLGAVLSAPSISQNSVLQNCISWIDRVSLLGYAKRENAFTYAKYSKERAIDLLTFARHTADLVVADISSHFAQDILSAVALEFGDHTARLCGCDLKSLSYFSSALPLLADSRFKTHNHFKILSNVKCNHDEDTFGNAYAGISGALPFSQELEQQFLDTRLGDVLSTKDGKNYMRGIRAILDVFGAAPRQEKAWGLNNIFQRNDEEGGEAGE